MEDINKSEKIKREDVHQRQRHLPDDVIIQHILPYLPIKPLTQFKSVSKHWYSSISSPNFILNHTKQPLFSHLGPPIESLFIQSGNNFYLHSCNNLDFDNVVESAESSSNLVKLDVDFDVDEEEEINLVGSSNGLVCLGEKNGKYFILYNPVTNQYYKYLTLLQDLEQFNGLLHIVWGFGYVSSQNDYKVVGIIQNRREARIVYVFSLKLNIWERIECGFRKCLLKERPKLVNETLHWTATRYLNEDRLDVVGFDLGRLTTESFPRMSMHLPRGRRAVPCVVGGCLSRCSFSSENGMELDIISPRGVVSVCYKCDFGSSDIKDLIGFTKTGKVVVVFRDPVMLGLVDSTTKKTTFTFEGKGRDQIDGYVPSQVSPHP